MGLKDYFAIQLGISPLNETAQHLVFKYLFLLTSVRSILTLSNTILILYVIDHIGYGNAGLVLAISFIVQAIFDYPTGVLSDWLGQKFVLILAFSSYAISFGLISVSTTFYAISVFYGIFAFAQAQESGALQTYFDNNYKYLADDDDFDRSIYHGLSGKLRTVTEIFSAMMLLVGGYLATQISRSFVFQVQAFALLFLVIITYINVNDYPGLEKDEINPKEYFKLFGEGISMIYRNKLISLIVISQVLYASTLGIFGNLVLFPIYFGFTGTDFGANVFRLTLFLGGSIAIWFSIDVVKKLKPTKWLPIIHIIHSVLFFAGMYVALTIYPIQNEFNMNAILVMGILIFTTHMLRVFIGTFLQRIYLDIIPDRKRNSFYSFIPTIVLLLQAPLSLQSGQIIEDTDHSLIFGFLGIIAFISSVFIFIAMTLYSSDPDSWKINKEKLES